MSIRLALAGRGLPPLFKMAEADKTMIKIETTTTNFLTTCLSIFFYDCCFR